MLTPLAAAGITLAAVGLLAVVAHAVAVRRRELAVRMALGAAPHEVVWGVLRDSWWISAPGMAAGLAGAIAAQRLLGTITYGASTMPVVVACALTIVLVLTTLAAWWPARRAAAIDPARVLRDG